jgi:hypothetical protein
MTTYYRLQTSENGNRLPRHWCYSEAWEQNLEGEWKDNREPGCQVWVTAARVAYAANGFECDGTYGADEYPNLLVIEADDDYVNDSVGEWVAVEPEGVEKAYALPTAQLVAFVEAGFEADDEYGEGEFAEWLEDHDEEFADWIRRNAKPVEIEFVETLAATIDEYLGREVAIAT